MASSVGLPTPRPAPWPKQRTRLDKAQMRVLQSGGEVVLDLLSAATRGPLSVRFGKEGEDHRDGVPRPVAHHLAPLAVVRPAADGRPIRSG